MFIYIVKCHCFEHTLREKRQGERTGYSLLPSICKEVLDSPWVLVWQQFPQIPTEVSTIADIKIGLLERPPELRKTWRPACLLQGGLSCSYFSDFLGMGNLWLPSGQARELPPPLPQFSSSSPLSQSLSPSHFQDTGIHWVDFAPQLTSFTRHVLISMRKLKNQFRSKQLQVSTIGQV